VETGGGCGDRRWVWRPEVGVETGGRCGEGCLFGRGIIVPTVYILKLSPESEAIIGKGNYGTP